MSHSLNVVFILTLSQLIALTSNVNHAKISYYLSIKVSAPYHAT